MTHSEQDEVLSCQPLFESSVQWCEQWLTLVYWRRLGSRHMWCQQWWRHPEALVRVEALWRSWEAMRIDDPMRGVAVWFVEIADPMMRELLDPDGPFKGCQPDRHRPRPEDELGLPVAPFAFDDRVEAMI